MPDASGLPTWESKQFTSLKKLAITLFRTFRASTPQGKLVFYFDWLQENNPTGKPDHIDRFDPARLCTREIVVADHCYACTAGAGSSCQGAVNT
jgi:hypothetical protein